MNVFFKFFPGKCFDIVLAQFSRTASGTLMTCSEWKSLEARKGIRCKPLLQRLSFTTTFSNAF